jgi:hypothetical protein
VIVCLLFIFTYEVMSVLWDASLISIFTVLGEMEYQSFYWCQENGRS